MIEAPSSLWKVLFVFLRIFFLQSALSKMDVVDVSHVRSPSVFASSLATHGPLLAADIPCCARCRCDSSEKATLPW